MKKLALIFFLCSLLTVHAAETQKNIDKIITTCAACHGANGISSNPQWPNLAGQHATYLSKLLKDMKLGSEIDSPIMTGLMRHVNEKEMDDLALYYAKMPTAKPSMPKEFALGKKLYVSGDYSKQIPACAICHGIKGSGNGQAGFPVLSGQHAAYIESQLLAFKQGKRKNDLNHVMQRISGNMNKDDMEAVANYIESLH